MMILLLIIVFIIFILLFIYNSFTIPIYVISMEKDKERRDILYKQIKPDEYYAVDGNSLNKEVLIESGIINNKDLKRGHIGCYLSHVHFLEKSNGITLILEDDAKIIDIKNFMNNIKNIILHAPKNWEIIFLGHNYYEIDGKITIGPSNVYNKINMVFGSHAYLVNINKEKIKNLFPIKEPYDIALSKHFNSYITNKIVELNNFPSNTENIN